MNDFALFQLAGVLYLVMPPVAWLAMAGRQTRAGDWWCVGGALLGVGILVTGSRGQVPEWLSVHVAVLALMLGALFRADAVLRDLQRALPWCACLVWVGLAVALSVLAVQNEWRSLQVLSNRLNISAATTLLTAVLWQLWQRSRSRNILWLALLYGGLTALMLINAALALWQGGSRPDNATTEATPWLVFAGALSAVFGHLAYLGYVFDQTLTKRQAYDREVATDQEVVALNRQVAGLAVRAHAGEQAALVAHEVNQPLTAIQLHAQLAVRMLQRPPADPATLQDLLGKIEAQIARLDVLVQRLRPQAAAPRTACAPQEVREALDETLDLLRHDPQLAAVSFQVTQRDSAPVSLTGAELAQLMFNLLRNAAEAAQEVPDGRVVVGVERRGAMLVIEVKDNGPGFAPAILAHIGRPFASTKPQGMGVGLAVCKGLVRQAGGQLTVANLMPTGARVEVALPVWG